MVYCNGLDGDGGSIQHGVLCYPADRLIGATRTEAYMAEKVLAGLFLNLLAFFVCAVFCIVRPKIVDKLLLEHSWSWKIFRELPAEGPDYDRRIRSVRNYGIYLLAFTLFMTILATGLVFREMPRHPKPPVFSTQPNFHRH